MPFTSQTAADLQTITDKLAECEQSIAEHEFKLPNASLRLALGTAEPGDADVGPRLKELHAERDLLRSALEAAEQAEADRLAAASQRELASALRAAAQHEARFKKELLDAAAKGAQMQVAFNRSMEAARSCMAALPQALRNAHWMQLSPKWAMRRLRADVHQAGHSSGEHVIPEVLGWSDLKGWASGKVPPLAVALEHDLGALEAKIRELISSSAVAGSPFLAAADDAAAPESVTGSGAAAPIPADVEAA